MNVTPNYVCKNEYYMFFLYNIFDLLGWMDTEVFSEWFDKFANSITERPLVLLFDGYMTHTSLPVIQRALNERIIIVKFPPHFMDVFKTSDMSCFGPLKQCWRDILQHRENLFGAKSSLSKGDFVDQLCRIWKFGMTTENVIGGFSSIGKYICKCSDLV